MLFGSDFFGHSHFYKLPFFATDLFRFFLATVIFIRIFFIVHCLVQIFLAPVIFIRCIFFNCFAPIFWQQSFLRHIFFIVHCLVQIFLAAFIFIRCIFFNCFAPIFLATVIFIRRIFLSYTVWLRFFSPQPFL